MMTRSQTRIAELEARIAELEAELKEFEDIYLPLHKENEKLKKEKSVLMAESDNDISDEEEEDTDDDEEDEEKNWILINSEPALDEEGKLDGWLPVNEEHFETYKEAKDAYDNLVKLEENHLNNMQLNPMREPICAEIALWSSKDYYEGGEERERWFYDFEEEETSTQCKCVEQEIYEVKITPEAAKLANQWQLDADDIADVKPTGADNTIRRNDLKEIVEAAEEAWEEEVTPENSDDEN